MYRELQIALRPSVYGRSKLARNPDFLTFIVRFMNHFKKALHFV
jgi:hypothetical protein